MFKKILCFVIAFITTAGFMLQAYAGETTAVIATPITGITSQNEYNAKISKDTAKELAGKFLKDFCEVNVEDKKYETRISLREDYGVPGIDTKTKSYVWELNYQYNSGNTNYSIMVTLNSETGKITGFNRYEYTFRGNESAKVSIITEEQARDIANEFIKKAYPDLIKEVQLKNNEFNKYAYINPNSPRYNFTYIRIANGIKFDMNSITLGVDGITGKVSSLNVRWSDNLEIPSVETNIDKEKAKEIYFNETDLKLNYFEQRAFRDNFNNKPSSITLVYNAEFKNGNFLDAKSGKMIRVTNVNPSIQKKDLSSQEKEIFLNKWKAPIISPVEIDEKKASEIAKEKIEELYGKGYEISSIRYEDNNNYGIQMRKKTWSIQFTNNKSIGDAGYIFIDALTGQLVSIDMYSRLDSQDITPFTPKITWDEAYSKAINMISKYYPDKIKSIITEQSYYKENSYYNNIKMPERYYNFNFIRQVNGIQYSSNSISLRFDMKTGEISNMRCFWDESIDFPGVKGVINIENAKRIFGESINPELVYAIINNSTDAEKPDYIVKLVYSPETSDIYYPLMFDAFTGDKIKLFQDNDVKLNTFKQLIKDHWGEKELGILAYQGILDIDTFKPDEEISRIEAIKLLVKVKGSIPYYINDYNSLKFTNIDKEDSNYKYLQIAVEYGLIKNIEGEFNGEERITREEMAELLVKLFNYEKLAKSKNIFSLAYTDAGEISTERYGYVAIGTGLELFLGDNGRFRPKDNTTMTEFAITIYKVLNLIMDLNK